MTLTQIQQDFVEASTLHATALISHYFQVKPGTPRAIDLLDTASMATDTATAAIMLAGVSAAPPTLGASIGVASAVIVVAKAGQFLYETCNSFSDHTPQENYPLSIKRDLQQLRMQVQLHRALHHFVVRYAYALHEIVDKRSLSNFAEQTAARLVKIMLAAMPSKQSDVPNAEDLLDGLLTSSKSSITREADWVTIQRPVERLSSWKSNKLPSKELWACPRWYLEAGNDRGKFIASNIEHHFLSTTTLPECGFIPMRRDKLELSTMAVNLKSHKAMDPVELPEPKKQLISKLYFLYPVRRYEVQAYLDVVRDEVGDTSSNQSLNEYLSLHFERPTIATCHNNELCGMDLSGGCFSEVDFHHADLSGCNLQNTNWSGPNTWLSETRFDNVTLDKRTNFQDVHAEESTWINVKFDGAVNLIGTKFNGAAFIHCTMSAGNFFPIGTEWLLAKFEHLDIVDKTEAFDRDFQTKLHSEQQQRAQLRVQLQEKIDNLSQVERQRWSDQFQADLIRDQRIASLEPGQNIIERLFNFWEQEINTSSHQQFKERYIELRAQSIFADKEANIQSLTTSLDEHVSRPGDVILMHGESGCGKSVTLKLLFEELLNFLLTHPQPQSIRHGTESNQSITPRVIPILIDLYDVSGSVTSRNILRTGLEVYFDKVHVDHLIKHDQCFIMIDNIDMANVTLQQLLDDCADLSKKFTHFPTFIFSAKTDYLLNLHNYREIFMSRKLRLSAEYVIQPFDSSQIKRFFRLHHPEENYQRFKSLQIHNPEISSMMKSPLMLSVIVCAYFSPSFGEEKINYRVDFYDAAWRALYEHVERLLPEQYKSYEDFVRLIQELALALFENEKDDTPFYKSENDQFNRLFRTNIKYLFFLHFTAKKVRFMHKSLGHYWDAQRLLTDLKSEDFLKVETLALWNRHLLSKFPDIQRFLVELIQKDDRSEILLQRLILVVMLSRDPEKEVTIAAANAITIRCKLNNNFNGLDLSNIKISGADLTGGSFVYTNLQGSQLRDVRFVRAQLCASNLRNADLSNAQFSDATSFIHTNEPLTIMAIYPSLEGLMLAFVRAPKKSYRNYELGLIKVEEGSAQVVQTWVAHTKKIAVIAWGVLKDTAILASAGESGRIRIWAFKDNVRPEEIMKLSVDKKPISAIAWSTNSEWLASGTQDGCVRIWEIATKTSHTLLETLESSCSLMPAYSPILSLVWGKIKPLLIALNNANNLYIWSSADHATPLSREQCSTDLLPFPVPVCSMALSLSEKQLALGQKNGNILIVAMEDLGSPKHVSIKPIILLGHKDEVRALRWAGPRLISSSADKTVRIWPHAKFSQILQHESAVEHLEISSNQHGLFSTVSGPRPGILLWDIPKLNEDRIVADALGMILCLSAYLEPHAIKIAVGFTNGAIKSYRMLETTQEKTEELLWEHDQVSTLQLAWSPDGQLLAALSKEGPVIIKNFQGAGLLTIQNSLTEFKSLAWIHQNLLLVSASNGLIYVYDILQKIMDETKSEYTVALLYQIPTNSVEALFCLAISPHIQSFQQRTLAVSRGKNVEICTLDFHSESFTHIYTHTRAHSQGNVTQLVWSPDGVYLASVVENRFVYVWQDDTKCLTYDSQTDVDDEIKCIKWCDKWLIVGKINQIIVWDTSLPHFWSKKPICIPWDGAILDSVMLENMASYLIISENNGIGLFKQDLFLNNKGTYAAWVAQIKPALLIRHANCTDSLMSPSTQEMIAQKGGIVITGRTGFFQRPKRPVTATITYPKASSEEELRQVSLRSSSSSAGSSIFGDDRSESTRPSPRDPQARPSPRDSLNGISPIS